MKRRNFLTGITSTLLSGACTSVDLTSGDRKSCDYFHYDLNSGLDFARTTVDQKVFHPDGANQSKWINTAHRINPHITTTESIVVGDFFGGVPALGPSKWIRSSVLNDGNGQDIFSYCFGVLKPTGYFSNVRLKEISVISNHNILTIRTDSGHILGQNLGNSNSIVIDDQNSQGTILDGVNCIHIVVSRNFNQAIDFSAISVVGRIEGIGCSGGNV